MKGLTSKEVLESRKNNGSNEILEGKSDSFFKLLLNSLGDPIIKILLIALAIKTVFLFKSFDWYETIGIVISIMLASFISSISEYASESAFKKLQEEIAKINCKVIRDAKLTEIPINDVVVGDILQLEAGDKIAADGLVIEGELYVDESSINGETRETYKKKGDTVYRGTVVYSNRALVKVSSVGINTFYGTLALELKEKSPISPLKLRLTSLARFISKIGYIGAFLVFFSYLFKVILINNNFDILLIKKMITDFPTITGHILYGLTLCVTIIIVAVPEEWVP